MAERTGLSQVTIGRIWRTFELKPHRADTFKLSNDPLFVDKVVDVVGLYLDPPEGAVVLCADEQSQVQALARSQPAFSDDAVVAGSSAPMTTCGTGCRCCASRRSTPPSAPVISVACTGGVARSISKTFLAKIDGEVRVDLVADLVCDNYGTQSSPGDQEMADRASPVPHAPHPDDIPPGLIQVERWLRRPHRGSAAWWRRPAASKPSNATSATGLQP